ncbi:hypothetical protein [Roseovarius sp. SYSU LYC5161]|uniref:hypothetical protein n=1 Tax=Roseovarius halophilus (ex Wu et al. 2025) TaxID=3376060 RepID=UPI00399A0EDD
MDINERYGDAHDLSRIIDRQHAKKAMEIVAICIAAKGGKGATDALEDVKSAVEEGGATAVINFMAELIAHAYGKTVAVSGETAPDQ